jgi:hypothetical protein
MVLSASSPVHVGVIEQSGLMMMENRSLLGMVRLFSWMIW